MKQSVKKIGVGSLLVLLSAQLSGCDILTAGVQPSQVTSNQFLTQMKAHKFSAAYTLLSPTCKAGTTVQQMQNYWDLVEKNRGKVQSWTQQGIRVNTSPSGDRSINLTYALQCAKGTSGAQFICVDENGKWLIQGFNFSG